MALPTSPDTIVLFHNPNCSKSRATKALLEERDIDFEIREYLDQPLARHELRALEKRLGKPIAEWVRTGENAYAKWGPTGDPGPNELIELVAKNPICMERPILLRGDRAAVGRPPEAVLSLLP